VVYIIDIGWICFIFVYVQWTMKIKWHPLQQWLH